MELEEMIENWSEEAEGVMLRLMIVESLADA